MYLGKWDQIIILWFKTSLFSLVWGEGGKIEADYKFCQRIQHSRKKYFPLDLCHKQNMKLKAFFSQSWLMNPQSGLSQASPTQKRTKKFNFSDFAKAELCRKHIARFHEILVCKREDEC